MTDGIVIAEPEPLQQLACLQRAIALVQQSKSVDEVKNIRDQAQSVAAYMRQQNYGIRLQNDAAEVKIRAENRMGELLAEMNLNGGDRKSELHDKRVKLADMGITPTQSFRWQKIASIDNELFERHIAETKDAGKELTTAGLLKLAKSLAVDARTGEQVIIDEGTTTDLNTLIDASKKFGCIYADPPWQYGNQGTRAATGNHYNTMPLADIRALPIGQLAADDAHLHLWTTNAFLFDAKQVMEAWGFTYKSVMVWVKPQMGIGNYWRVSHEFMLLGTRGSTTFRDRGIMSWQQERRSTHSKKPELFRKLIERVSPGPFLELFARATCPGWSVWGNQIERSLLDADRAVS